MREDDEEDLGEQREADEGDPFRTVEEEVEDLD